MGEYFDVDGNQVTLPVLCMRDPGWAASRIAAMKAELDAARAENARLRKLFEKCPLCESPKVVAVCKHCGLRRDLE